jgi:transglutaminase-like putative cysteine protease
MRKILVASLLSLSLICTSGFGFADAAIVYDFDQAETGVVRVKLDDSYETNAIKIMVAREGENPEFYDYDRFAEFEAYGITAGEGTYQIGIYQNTTGNSYRSLSMKTVVVDEVDPLAPYLASVQSIRWEAEDEAAELALVLTEGIESDWAKVQAVHQYIIENITYDYDKAKVVQSGYLPNNVATLENGNGICYDYSSLMASMLRSLNIPTKLVMGYSNTKDVYHAWNEVYDAEREEWILVDSTFDASFYQHGFAVEMERDSAEYRVEKVY